MNKGLNSRFDVLIAGSGFGGSLTAIGLHQIGYKVLLLEKYAHPRFAIGESSTPIADMILRELAGRYDLPWLQSLSRYGSWQQAFPEVVCGLKRGFSYFAHQPGRPFKADKDHSTELLVAASPDDERSDTHWLRADTDAFFVKKARQAGVVYLDRTDIMRMDYEAGYWLVQAERGGRPLRLRSRWFVDATGNGRLAAVQLGVKSSSRSFRTHTRAVYSHFRDAGRWSALLAGNAIPAGDYPFNPDHSALHHLMEEGWMWMLRFNNGLTSAGISVNENRPGQPDSTIPDVADGRAYWRSVLRKYPSLQEIFTGSRLADSPGRLVTTGRLQRCMERVSGRRWAALPNSAGFVDPLHSTGIAHTLSGVERILHNFEDYGGNPEQLQPRLDRYGEAVREEIDFIDLLVSGCHATTRHMELFTLYSMLYFTASIAYEQKRLSREFNIETDRFLNAGHPEIPVFSRQLHGELQAMLMEGRKGSEEVSRFREKLRRSIEPWNTAGLLRPEAANMYRQTIADF